MAPKSTKRSRVETDQEGQGAVDLDQEKATIDEVFLPAHKHSLAMVAHYKVPMPQFDINLLTTEGATCNSWVGQKGGRPGGMSIEALL